MLQLSLRVGYHKTLAAIANKHTRMIWAILANGEAYAPDAWQRHRRAVATKPSTAEPTNRTATRPQAFPAMTE